VGKPGRKPLPLTAHLARGTHRPARHGPLTLEPARRNGPATSTPPRCPPGLSPASRQLWSKLTTEWVLSADALAVLHGGLQARDLAQRCLAEVAAAGPTYTTESGLVKAHPGVAQSRDLLSEFRASLRQLRLPEEE
jgi:hypothetical protein